MSRQVGRPRGAKAKADRLYSKWVRSIGHCERCAATENLQCAHLKSRRYARWRCDPRNAVCLCARCHHYFTDNPVEFGIWVFVDERGRKFREMLKEQIWSDKHGGWKVPRGWWEQKVAEIESWEPRT